MIVTPRSEEVNGNPQGRRTLAERLRDRPPEGGDKRVHHRDEGRQELPSTTVSCGRTRGWVCTWGRPVVAGSVVCRTRVLAPPGARSMVTVVAVRPCSRPVPTP